MANKKIQGRKGGSSSSRTPTEQPDDLQSVAKAKILLALGEGEFSGGLTGQSIFLDGTPLLNADGSSNFSGVTWEFRAGTQAQTYIQGMPGSENEISAGGITVSSATPGPEHLRIHSFLPFACASNGRPFSGRKMTAIWSVTPLTMRLICRQTAARFRR
jgi:hypothetical protein